MLKLNFLQSYFVDHGLNSWGRGHDAISWSSDHQVLLVDVKGVNVYECLSSPGIQKRPPPATIASSRINIFPKSHAHRLPDLGSVAVGHILSDEDKQHIFDLMRDNILRPQEYCNTIYHSYVLKAAWSPHPVYRGVDVSSRCVVGVLTATHQLYIYGRKDRNSWASEGWTEPWEMVLDISALCNKHMLQIWESSEPESESSSHVKKKGDPAAPTPFDLYKMRLYQLAIIDFIWLPDWDVDPDLPIVNDAKGVFRLYLMTFHASGDVCIWKITMSKTVVPLVSAKIVYRKISMFEDIVATAAFSYVTPELGLLVVGTNKGKLSSHSIQRKKGGSRDGKYTVTEPQILWEEDLIQVERILLSSTSSDRRKVDIIILKNPNIVIATSASVALTRVVGKEFSIVKAPNGPITGIAMQGKGQYMLVHEPGVLSFISFDNGELECIEGSSVSISSDIQKNLKRKAIKIGQAVQKVEKKERKTKQLKDEHRRLIFKGIALSPNKTLICTARTLGVYHDHLQIRRPTQIVFYSLLPEDDPVSKVRGIYAENLFSLWRITDVLVPFRAGLRGKATAALYKEILDWAMPLEEKTVEVLRLLLWCLKVQPKTDPIEWEMANAEKMFNPQVMKSLMAQEALYQHRLSIITDKIIQRRCVSLLQTVIGNQNESQFSLTNELNQQSLLAIYQYLETKSNCEDLPAKPSFSSTPHLPLCHWCKGPLEFPLEEQKQDGDENVLDDAPCELWSGLDAVKFSGFKWNERRHPVKEFGIHKPEICILSLLPLQFPYRRCPNCLVPALLEPSFAQLPYCPLCDSYMYPCQRVVELREESVEQGPFSFTQEFPITIKTEPGTQAWIQPNGIFPSDSPDSTLEEWLSHHQNAVDPPSPSSPRDDDAVVGVSDSSVDDDDE